MEKWQFVCLLIIGFFGTPLASLWLVKIFQPEKRAWYKEMTPLAGAGIAIFSLLFATAGLGAYWQASWAIFLAPVVFGNIASVGILSVVAMIVMVRHRPPSGC